MQKKKKRIKRKEKKNPSESRTGHKVLHILKRLLPLLGIREELFPLTTHLQLWFGYILSLCPSSLFLFYFIKSYILLCIHFNFNSFLFVDVSTQDLLYLFFFHLFLSKKFWPLPTTTWLLFSLRSIFYCSLFILFLSVQFSFAVYFNLFLSTPRPICLLVFVLWQINKIKFLSETWEGK